MQGYKVIDSDGHVEAAIAENWRKWVRAPHGDRVVKQTQQSFDRSGDLAVRRRGMWDAPARLKDMDTDGIHAAVLFGGIIGLRGGPHDDLQYSIALCQGYNNWLQSYCSANPERLKGVAVTPLASMDESLKELRRAVTEMGFVGIVFPPFFQDKNLDDPYFEPLYAECEALDTPILVHGPGAVRFDSLISGRYHTHFRRHALDFPLALMISSMDMVVGGIFHRYQKLRVAFLEGGCGWVPFWLDRLDEHFEKLPGHVPHIDRKPSEYMKTGRLFFSCEPEEAVLPYVAASGLEDYIIYASDYAHWDSIFPGSVKAISDRDDLPERAKRKILSDNSLRLYGMKG